MTLTQVARAVAIAASMALLPIAACPTAHATTIDCKHTGPIVGHPSEKLRDEFDRRLRDPAYIADHLTRAKNHLYGGEVTPGFEVDTLSTDGYEQRISELGEQVRTSKHRHADG